MPAFTVSVSRVKLSSVHRSPNTDNMIRAKPPADPTLLRSCAGVSVLRSLGPGHPALPLDDPHALAHKEIRHFSLFNERPLARHGVVPGLLGESGVGVGLQSPISKVLGQLNAQQPVLGLLAARNHQEGDVLLAGVVHLLGELEVVLGHVLGGDAGTPQRLGQTHPEGQAIGTDGRHQHLHDSRDLATRHHSKHDRMTSHDVTEMSSLESHSCLIGLNIVHRGVIRSPPRLPRSFARPAPP